MRRPPSHTMGRPTRVSDLTPINPGRTLRQNAALNAQKVRCDMTVLLSRFLCTTQGRVGAEVPRVSHARVGVIHINKYHAVRPSINQTNKNTTSPGEGFFNAANEGNVRAGGVSSHLSKSLREMRFSSVRRVCV